MTASAPKKESSQPAVATSAHHVHGTAEARLLGSAVAGVSELALFHPVDTVAKRLMTTEAQLIVVNNMTATAANLNQAIFKDAAALNSINKLGSLFPGVGFGAVYKVLQRVYKFGGQVSGIRMMRVTKTAWRESCCLMHPAPRQTGEAFLLS